MEIMAQPLPSEMSRFSGYEYSNTSQTTRLHNAMWPGVVGKGTGAEPYIDLDTMLKLTAAADGGWRKI
jgi:hypothetical protein